MKNLKLKIPDKIKNKFCGLKNIKFLVMLGFAGMFMILFSEFSGKSEDKEKKTSDSDMSVSDYAADMEKQLENISVLIDGKYKEELNENSLLRGSSNQRIHILEKEHKDKYDIYLKTETNKIQNFTTNDGVVSVGIHKPDFMKEEK